jgi:hypothetical protein
MLVESHPLNLNVQPKRRQYLQTPFELQWILNASIGTQQWAS